MFNIGGEMTFSIAISAGNVEYLEVILWSPEFYLTNSGSLTATSMTVNSFTGLN